MHKELIAALRKIQRQISYKTQKRNSLDVEIAQLQATERSLHNIDHGAKIPWTDNVLAALKKYPGRPMTAAEIRNELMRWGYDFRQIRNPLAFVNTAVQRLNKQGRVRRSKHGRPYRFVF